MASLHEGLGHPQPRREDCPWCNPGRRAVAEKADHPFVLSDLPTMGGCCHSCGLPRSAHPEPEPVTHSFFEPPLCAENQDSCDYWDATMQYDERCCRPRSAHPRCPMSDDPLRREAEKWLKDLQPASFEDRAASLRRLLERVVRETVAAASRVHLEAHQVHTHPDASKGGPAYHSFTKGMCEGAHQAVEAVLHRWGLSEEK